MKAPVTWDVVREIARALPGVEEGFSYRTPAFRVRGKLLVRLREDGESLVIKIDFDERDLLMAANPRSFYITDHYSNYPALLVRLATVSREELRDLLEQSWRRSAPKRMITAYDSTS